MQNFTSGKSDVYVLAAAAMHGFTMVIFTEPVSSQNTFVRGTCAPPSALLVALFNDYSLKISLIGHSPTYRHSSAEASYIVPIALCPFGPGSLYFE